MLRLKRALSPARCQPLLSRLRSRLKRADYSILCIQVIYEFFNTVEGLHFALPRIKHCGNCFVIGHQRLERKRFFRRGTSQHDPKSIGYGQPNASKHGRCLVFDVFVNAGANESVPRHKSLPLLMQYRWFHDTSSPHFLDTKYVEYSNHLTDIQAKGNILSLLTISVFQTDRRDAGLLLYRCSKAQTSHWVSIAAGDRGTDSPSVLQAREPIGAPDRASNPVQIGPDVR